MIKKFKVWDGVKVREDITGFETDGKGLITGVFIDGDYYDVEEGKAKLIQYTGLKDKNGVEIYEGDVCKFNKDEGAIEFCDFGWVMRYKNGDFNNHLHYVKDKLEVIGNIHENPELLNKE